MHAVTGLLLRHIGAQWKKCCRWWASRHDRSTPLLCNVLNWIVRKNINLWWLYCIVLKDCLWDTDTSMIDWNLAFIFSTKDIESLLQLHSPGVAGVCWFSFPFHRIDNVFRLKYVMCVCVSLCVSRFKIECAIIYLCNADIFGCVKITPNTSVSCEWSGNATRLNCITK